MKERGSSVFLTVKMSWGLPGPENIPYWKILKSSVLSVAVLFFLLPANKNGIKIRNTASLKDVPAAGEINT